MSRWLRTRLLRVLTPVLLVTGLLAAAAPGAAAPRPSANGLRPTFTRAAAFDVSPTMRAIARQPAAHRAARPLPPERGPVVHGHGFAGDGAVQSAPGSGAIPAPSVSFEGLSNDDNPFHVAPPDPVGDVGPNHYVEMVNVAWAVYDNAGTLLLG